MTIGGVTYTFAHPALLWLLAVPALLLGLYLWRELRDRKAHLRVTTLQPFSRRRFAAVRILRHLPMVFRLLAIILLILALARPQTTSRSDSIRTQGIDIMMALDVSGSMETRDFDGGMSRLDAMKVTAARFVEGRPADRIGLVLFGAESYTLCPLTGDRNVIIDLLGGIQIGYVDENGTAIGEGLGTAVARIKDSEAKSKVIILLTDGVNNAGGVSPANAADLAVSAGVKVYTIGMAGDFDPWAGRIQRPAPEELFDAKLLQEIADKTGGRYYKATNNTALKEIYDEINELDKTELQVSSRVRHDDVFPTLGLLAGLCLLLEILLRLFIRRMP